MIKGLVICLLFWVVIVPGAIGSFLIFRFFLDSHPPLSYLLAVLAAAVSVLSISLGPIVFPLHVATDYRESFYDLEITKPGGPKCLNQ
jgi:hypothetical protein